MPQEMKQFGKPIGDARWYEIDGQEFYQQTLVLGQTRLIVPFLHGASFSDLQSQEVLDHLGEKIGRVLEIVLVPKGKTQKEHVKELGAPGKIERADMFLNGMTHMDLMQVIEDFFACNLDSSLMTLIAKGPQALMKQQDPGTPATNTNGSAPSSHEATLHSEATSLG